MEFQLIVPNTISIVIFTFINYHYTLANYENYTQVIDERNPDISNTILQGPIHSHQFINSTKNGKFFPLFTLVRFSNEPCRTNNEDNGICYTRGQCTALGGVAAGSCAKGLGVCCQFFSSCGSIVNQNQTFFRNPDYPNKYRPATGSDVCQIRIRKQLNTCQLRLNFIKFDIDSPVPSMMNVGTQMINDAGTCKTDMLTISAQASGAPALCGNMDGQHMYLEFGSSDTITLNVLLSNNVMRDREWNIEILMIPCRAQLRAPNGCLQYFQGVSGQLQSFNFAGGIHLANLIYSVCIRIEEGMRSIDWSACNAGDVKISGPTPLPSQTATTALLCPTMNPYDYITIIGGVGYPTPTTVTSPMIGTQSNTDRFCDINFGYANSFVRTSVKPFIVTFRTDGAEKEIINDASIGFCLKWQQSPNN